MLAVEYRGPYRIRTVDEPTPAIEHPQNAIVQVVRSCICGSDLHHYHGLAPDTRVGSTFGHEFVGQVVDVGSGVKRVRVGERVLVPFNIFCGTCFFRQRELFGSCHATNPEATAAGGIHGYSHSTGGYDGGQAQFVRVPMADVGPTKMPDDLHAEDAVLLTDAFPTAYQAAEMGDIREGDTVVVFGAGPIGLFAAKSAWLMGAGRVIVVDHVEYRLEFAQRFAQCEVIDFRDVRGHGRAHQEDDRRSGRGRVHRLPLEEVADAYHLFSSKLDGCIKTVLIPPGADELGWPLRSAA